VDKSERKEKKSKMKATKDFKLLSFGEEAEGDEETLNEVLFRECKLYRYCTQYSSGTGIFSILKKRKMKAIKDFKLLSFGEEAEGDEETPNEVPVFFQCCGAALGRINGVAQAPTLLL
jgi:hypothetical protein